MRPGFQPVVVGRSEKPYPGIEGMTTWNASCARPPWAVGLVRGSMTLRNSRTEPGQPWVRIIGSASWWRDRTWMKWMSSPSILVLNCGRELSFASIFRQS